MNSIKTNNKYEETHVSPSPITTLSWLPFTNKHLNNTALQGGDTKRIWLEGLPLSNPFSESSIKKKQSLVFKTSPGFVIYGNMACSYCTLTRSWFELYKIQFIYHDIDTLVEMGILQKREDIWKKLGKKRIGVQRTVPIIFLDGTLIGGYAELIMWAKDNIIIKQ